MVTLAVSATVFEIFRLDYRKLLILVILATFPCLTLPLGITPFELYDEIWLQKTRIVGLPACEEIVTLLRFDTITARDGRTDKQTRCCQRPALA